MMAGQQWTDKYAIMRDLSRAQGCVPADVERPVGAADKPPSQEIVEETEEEFFKNCIGDGDFAAPDLGLIKQMLDMVRESEGASDLEDCIADEILEITKLNPLSAVFTPSISTPPLPPADDVQLVINGTSNVAITGGPEENGYADDLVLTGTFPDKTVDKKHKMALKKTRNHRNVAVTSLLATIAAKNASKVEKDIENKITNGLPVKLLKPTDFVLADDATKSTEKVNDWLKAGETNKGINKVATQDKLNVLMFNPSSMFKKKTGITNDSKSHKVVPVQKQVKSPPKDYVPSSQAKEYFKQFEQRSKMKQIVQEDIWAQAKRQMKEMDEQRKREAEHASQLSLSSETTISSETTEQKLDVVRLPMHRHLLTGECLVCEVMCRKEPNSSEDDHVASS